MVRRAFIFHAEWRTEPAVEGEASPRIEVNTGLWILRDYPRRTLLLFLDFDDPDRG